MRRFTVPEKTFLKNFALNQFNFQHGEKIKEDECDIQSIATENDYRLGYEIIYKCRPNEFKIRMYLNIARTDKLSPFKLKVRRVGSHGNLDDEYFVTYGTIDSAHAMYNNYSLTPINYDSCDTQGYLLNTMGGNITLVSGGSIILH